MAARALWKGQLRRSLDSIPVELFSATRSGASVSFRQIHKPSGKPIHYQKVVEGIGPIDVDDISPLYFDKPYYLVPADELAEGAYRVVRDALRQSERIGLGLLTMRGREYLVAVKPCGDGLLLDTLRYTDELRKADPMFSDISGKKAEKELLEVASALIEKKTAPFDANAFKDNYTAALKELVKRKMKGKSTRIAVEEGKRPERRGDNVVDLMAALKKSLEGGEGKKSQPKAQSSSRRGRRKSA